MTDLRVMDVSRDTRDWLQAGSSLLREIASDFAADLDPAPLVTCADRIDTVVAEWDANEAPVGATS